MKCPFCGSPGFPRQSEIYNSDACHFWICVKCPTPVSYHSHEKKVAIWVLHNGCWYTIIYMKAKQEYIVQKEAFNLVINREESREDYTFDGEFVMELPSEENVTPANAAEKLALWLTFS